ncbi:MAG: quinone-dependent dihydroorotate dehydrogenase, partial [Planctomycetota bacterium]
MSITSRLAYHYLRALPAEAAHNVGTWAIKHELMGEALPPYKPVKLFGKQLANGLGLAAGFDKSAKLLRHLSFYGFGFIEVGSVTFRGGKGNPKPRMFRLGDDLMNRMGLPGDSAEVVAQRLADAPLDDNFGVNIAKTHDPDCVGDAAIDD